MERGKEERRGWLAPAVGLVLLIVVCPAADAGVMIRPVGSALGDSSANPDVAFGLSGELTVAYCDVPNESLNLLEVACGPVLPLVVEDYVSCESWSSLEHDALGRMTVIYPDGEGQVVFAWDAGPPFGIQTISLEHTQGVMEADHALDTVGRAYIGYARGDGVVELTWFDTVSGTWVQDWPGGPLSDPGDDALMSVAVNQQDEVLIAYVSEDRTIVLCAKALGGWMVREYELEVPTKGLGGVGLAVDVNGDPCVAYVASSRVKVARFGPSAVTTEEVDMSKGGCLLGAHSLAIDFAGRMRLTYLKKVDESIWLALNDFGWVTGQLDAGVGEPRPAVALDDQGRWVVVYRDDTHDLLKIASASVDLGNPFGDYNCDGYLDLVDHAPLLSCLAGPEVLHVPQDNDVPWHDCLSFFEWDEDGDIDLADYGGFQAEFGGGL